MTFRFFNGRFRQIREDLSTLGRPFEFLEKFLRFLQADVQGYYTLLLPNSNCNLTSCQESDITIDMNLLPVGEFKAKFSEVLQKVQEGASFGITYGKDRKKVAMVMPYQKYLKKTKFKLGLLEGKASFKIHNNFKMTDEEFLKS